MIVYLSYLYFCELMFVIAIFKSLTIQVYSNREPNPRRSLDTMEILYTMRYVETNKNILTH